MASSVSAELLKQLSVASSALNNATDEFNQQIKNIEEALASYSIGISAWVPAYTIPWEVCDEETGTPIADGETKYFLGYQKSGGKWSLLVASECDYNRSPGKPDRTDWVLRDAPREVRIRAIGAIPKLLEALIAEANRLAAEVSRQTVEVRTLSASIKPKKEK
jgi:hypothetical protein